MLIGMDKQMNKQNIQYFKKLYSYMKGREIKTQKQRHREIGMKTNPHFRFTPRMPTRARA